MTAREQTGDGEFNRLVLSYNNFTNLLCESVNVVGHPEIICGNAAIRKQDMRNGCIIFLFLLLYVTFSIRLDLGTRFRGGVTSGAPGGCALPRLGCGGVGDERAAR